MASADDAKKKEGEEDLLSHLPGYTPFQTPNSHPGQLNQAGQPLPTGPAPAPQNANPWFPHQDNNQAPVYPVNPGYVGPSEPIGPTGIELPKLRPQDDPNSSEYIPRTPVLNAPAPDPSSPWVPVPEPKWDLFADEPPRPPMPAQPIERKAAPTGASQANAIPFNTLPIVTGPSYAPEEPQWPGAAPDAQQQAQYQAQQQAQYQAQQQAQYQAQQQAQYQAQQQAQYQAQQQAQYQAQQQAQYQAQQQGEYPAAQQGQIQPQYPQSQFPGQLPQQPQALPGQFFEQQHLYQQPQYPQPQTPQPPQPVQNQQPVWPNANPNPTNLQPPPRMRSKLLAQAEEKEMPPPSIGLSFSKNDILGIATYSLNVTKDILSNPRQYFQELPLTGGYGEPLLYLLFTVIISALMFAIGHLNPLLFFWGLIIGFLSVTVGAVITDLAFKKLGGKGDLEGTFRVLAYSKATFVISWIALGPLSLGMMLAAMATGYMNYIGLMRVQGLSPKSTLIIVGVLSLLSMIFRWSCPGV